MKIGYFADGPWSHLALERLAADPRFEVAFIVPRFDTRDPVLADWARRLGVEFLLLDNVNSPQSIGALRSFDAELFVSMSYNQIFKPPLIAVPARGVINCHAGALPFYRGRNILNWALINDADRFGVTVHTISDGTIDAGDILVQDFLPITDADTYGTLLARAIEACASALVRALDLLERGAAQPVPQASLHPVGMYCGRRRPGDEWVDWQWPSRRLFNFIRAISPPGPGARTLLADNDVKLLRAEMIEHAPAYIATAGEVVGITPRGPVIKTGDTTLLLTEYQVEGDRALRVGARLGADPWQIVNDLRTRVAELERRAAQQRMRQDP